VTAYQEQRYSIALLDEDGSVLQELAREDRLDVARTLYELMQAQFVGDYVVLRDRDRIIAKGKCFEGGGSLTDPPD
jgi:hypothetical protein